MCGIFGIYDPKGIQSDSLRYLARHAEQRGIDSSGLLYFRRGKYELRRADVKATRVLASTSWQGSTFLMGHSRLVTNGEADNQPVAKKSVLVIHNGIVVNDKDIWPSLKGHRELEVDTEVIAQTAESYLQKHGTIAGVSEVIFNLCEGSVSCAIAAPE
jgi:glucosamine 6-phosphate synthetase-like amidotransferase/phosphosugar isomerase protein